MRLLPLLPVLLAACSSAPPSPYNDLASYRCADGTTLRVRFAPDSAHVTLPDDTVLILQQQVAASGIWYAAAGYELRGKNDEAMWTVAPQEPVACRIHPSGTPIASAQPFQQQERHGAQ